METWKTSYENKKNSSQGTTKYLSQSPMIDPWVPSNKRKEDQVKNLLIEER